MDWARDDEDSIYVTPEPPQVASTSAEERPIARMHTSRVSKARKSLKYKNKRTASRPRPPSRRQNNTEGRVPDWTVGSMVGNCPPFNANSGWMPDPANKRVYTYGGLGPGDESEIPTSDFYVCDTTTMEWKDITVCGSTLFFCLGFYLFLHRILSSLGTHITRFLGGLAIKRQPRYHSSPNRAAPSSPSIIPALYSFLEDTRLKRTLHRPRSSS